jgi:hypothetical protein
MPSVAWQAFLPMPWKVEIDAFNSFFGTRNTHETPISSATHVTDTPVHKGSKLKTLSIVKNSTETQTTPMFAQKERKLYGKLQRMSQFLHS